MSNSSGTFADQSDVADALRAAVREGELAPGQRLVEAELSETFGASRGAVRAALFELAHEGVVERIANKGARVRVVTLDEAIQVTEVRKAVESLCAETAAVRITDEEIAELRELAEQLKQAVAEMNLPEYVRLTRASRERMIAISGLTVAAEVLARLQIRSVRYQFRLAYRPGRPQQALPFYLATIDALCARDPEAATEAVRAHLSNVVETLKSDTHPRTA